MEKAKEIDQLLNERVAVRNHLAQYEASKADAKKNISWYLIRLDLNEMISCLNHAELLGKVKGASLLVISH